MRLPRNFAQVDVFAHRPGTGNPLAVVLDAEGWDSAAMQAFAHWTNLSETSFLLPPSQPGASYRVRIFTPRQELPFAGHPSVGSAHAALEAGLVVAKEGRLLQECSAGLLPMRVMGSGAARQIFVRAPRGRVSDTTIDAALLDAALADLPRGRLPAVVLDNGPRWLLAEIADAPGLRAFAPPLPAIAALTIATDTVGLALFARSADPAHAMVVRAFCPADGIPEDPVTGSANAAIGAWLHENLALPGRRYIASQGREVGRDGRVEVELDDEDETWIGGQTQTVVTGTVAW